MMRYSILVFACVYAVVISAFAQMPGGVPDGFYGYNQAGPTPPPGDNSSRFATTAFVQRMLLSTNTLNLFVSTTGNDVNNCLSAATPCATIQHAIDLAPFAANTNISLADGTYNQEGMNAYYYRAISIVGNCNDPSLVKVKGVNNGTTVFTGQDHVILILRCMTLQTQGTGSVALFVRQFAIVDYVDVWFDNFPGGIHIAMNGSSTGCGGTIKILGSAAVHASISYSKITMECPMELPNILSFTVFLSVDLQAVAEITAATFSGAGATGSFGTQCIAATNGIIMKGATTLPGDVACSSFTQGQVL